MTKYRRFELIFLGLYTICVCKDYFNECGYLSKPFGIPSILNDTLANTLEEMQKEHLPDRPLPQVRLLAHKLDTEKTKTFIFPSISDSIFNELLENMHTLITQSMVDNLTSSYAIYR